jgi:hypothetical protein
MSLVILSADHERCAVAQKDIVIRFPHRHVLRREVTIHHKTSHIHPAVIAIRDVRMPSHLQLTSWCHPANRQAGLPQVEGMRGKKPPSHQPLVLRSYTPCHAIFWTSDPAIVAKLGAALGNDPKIYRIRLYIVIDTVQHRPASKLERHYS